MSANVFLCTGMCASDDIPAHSPLAFSWHCPNECRNYLWQATATHNAFDSIQSAMSFNIANEYLDEAMLSALSIY